MAANTYGRQVVVPLTNKSGGGVIAGDVVVVDTANNDAFTTTTSAGFTGGVGIAQETIANDAVGRVLIGGYAALVNVNASVTRGQFGTTHTVAKQATGAAARGVGTFCQWLTGGTTPDAIVYPVDLLGSSLTNPMTTLDDIIKGGAAGVPARLGIGAAGGKLGRLNGVVAYDSGTSNPTATTGDRFWRTDLGLEIYYDGTRWLTTKLYREAFTIGDVLSPSSTSGNNLGRMSVWHTTYNIWAVTYYTSLFVLTTNNGSNFWTLTLNKTDAANSATAIVAPTTAAYTASTWTTAATAIGALVDSATHKVLDVIATKTGAPGNLYFSHALAYRLVIT